MVSSRAQPAALREVASMDNNYWRLAAKFGRGDRPGDVPAYHPLYCHMADVAAVAQQLWDRVLPSSVRDLLSNGLGLPEETAREWVGFLAGLHDFGKATRDFQGRDSTAAARLGDALPPGTKPDPGHGFRTTGLLRARLERLGVPRVVAHQLATITGGHHGRFLQVGMECTDAGLDEELAGIREAWCGARDHLFEAFRNLFDLGEAPALELSPPASMALAGLITVADWLGSMETHFPWAAPADASAYFRVATERARLVLEQEDWIAPPPAIARFEDLFPGIAPRPLQTTTIDLAAKLRGPALVIVEAPMGEGKTEAALFLANTWRLHHTRGAYFALPTQATANQMHDRVAGVLARQLRPHETSNLVLAHGSAWLLRAALPSNVHGDSGRSDAVATGTWFLDSKRALLAPHGVGTIDQALLSVLPVRHVFVRLFALAGKAVIIDEAHAYDTYMTGLLERLMEWLAALRSPVALLSATLPTARRRRLMEAYQRGLGAQPTPEAPVAASYPSITWTTAAESGAVSFPASPRSHRELPVVSLPEDVDTVAARVEELVHESGCAAIICNTVGRAQELFRELSQRGHFAAHELSLFHSRFRAGERAGIESLCRERFGPGAAARPSRHILVATQVIEQSLDVDFDVMVSDFAPLDLLLQRSGRLQRHDRGTRHHQLQLFVRGPQEADGAPVFDSGTQHVYDRHILLRTWWYLKSHLSISIPHDLQVAIDEVYREDEGTPDGLPAAALTAWRQSFAEMTVSQQAEDGQARLNRLATPGSRKQLERFMEHIREEDDPELPRALQAVTRLGDPSLDVVLLRAGEALPKPLRREHTPAVLLRSVPVSHRGVVPLLLEAEPPKAFARLSALRHHRLLQLDDSGVCMVGLWLLRYSDDLGLEITRKDQQP